MNKKRIIAFILAVLMIVGLVNFGLRGNSIKADKTDKSVSIPTISASVRDDGGFDTKNVKMVQNEVFNVYLTLTDPQLSSMPDNFELVDSGWFDYDTWNTVTGGTYVNITDNPDKDISALGEKKTTALLENAKELAIFVAKVTDKTIPDDEVQYLFPVLVLKGAVEAEPANSSMSFSKTDFNLAITPEKFYTSPDTPILSGSDVYVGGYKYVVSKDVYDQTAIDALTSWADPAGAVSEINGKIGDISYDGEYHLYKAYFIGDYVKGSDTGKKDERYSSIPEVTNATSTPVSGSGSYDSSSRIYTYTVNNACANQDIVSKFTFDRDVIIGGTTYQKGAEYTCTILKEDAIDGGNVTKSFEVKNATYTDKEPSITVKVSVNYIDTTPTVSFVYDDLVNVGGEWFTNIKNFPVKVTTSIASPAEVTSVALDGAAMNKDGGGKFSLDKELTEGENALEAIATSDTAKSGKANATFILDSQSPKVNEFKITQTDPKDGQEKSEVVNRNQYQKNMKVTATETFKIDLKFADPGTKPSGVKKITVIRDGNSIGIDGKDITGQTSYSFTENLKSVKANYYGKTIPYTVEVEDALGNVEDYIFKVKFANDQINATVGIFKDKECTTKVNDGILTANKVLYLKYTVKTYDVELVDWKISDTEHAKLIKKEQYSTKDSKYVYKLVYEFKTNDSGDFTDVTGTFTNEDGISAYAKVKSLKFDLSNPTLALPEADGWYTELLLTIEYPAHYKDVATDPDKGKWQSGIKSAIVSTSNCDSPITNMEILVDETPDPNNKYQLVVGQSKNYEGTNVTLKATDNAGRTSTLTKVYYVDSTAPTASLTVNNTAAAQVLGKVLPGNPVIAYFVDDNIQINKYTLKVTAPDGTVYQDVVNYSSVSGGVITSDSGTIALSGLLGRFPEDGQYTLELTAFDNPGTGLSPAPITTTFIIDNTQPVIEAKIITKDPAKISKNSHKSYDGTIYGAYYAENVTISVKLIENNIETISATDNGISIKNISWADAVEGTSKVKTATFTVSGDGSHNVKVGLLDKAGTSAIERAFNFIIDTKAPDLVMTLNNAGVASGTTGIELTTPANVGISVIDANKDTQDLTRRTVIAYPGGGNSDLSVKIPEGVTLMEAEGDYTVSFKAVDLAGNESATYTMGFRVDTGVPEVSITGVPGSGASTSDVNVTFTVKDSFYWDLQSAKATIYKAVDGSAESVMEDMALTPNSAQYSVSKLINEDGEYRMTLSATDKVGHSADTAATFILDGTAPLIELMGVKNYDATDKDVTLNVKVTEAFFRTNKFSITGTRTDIDGKKNDIKFSSYNVNSAKVSNVKQLFKEDGIYDIVVMSQDRAGNKDEKKLHFIIDKTAPELTKDLDGIDGVAMNSFTWNYKIDEIVRDLTVCQVSVYVDGTEYDGVSKLANGSHVLKIVAEDELGHKTERTINLIIDDITPTILITGVEKGANLNEATTVNVSVQLDEDKLESVELNGKPVDVVDNAATIQINNRGSYRLTVTASDAAGNKSTEDMTFSYGSSPKGILMWVAIIGGAVLLLLVLIIILARRGKKQ